MSLSWKIEGHQRLLFSLFFIFLSRSCAGFNFSAFALRSPLVVPRSTIVSPQMTDNDQAKKMWEQVTNRRATTDSSAAASASETASRAIDFFTLTRNLKTTKRTGWVMSGVKDPESISDHMYRMTLMTYVASFSSRELDTNKCIKLAMIHDLAEAKVGDITPHCGVSEQDKYNMELKTMKSMKEMLGSALGGEEMLELWTEYEEGVTEEARLLKDLDKIEMILQAQEYEAEGSSEKNLNQFFSSTEGKWRTEIGKAWAKEIVSRRNLGDNSKDKSQN